MDEFDHPGSQIANQTGTVTIATFLLAASLSLATGLLALSEMAQRGPDVGAIVSFDPARGPRYWEQPGIVVAYAPGQNQAPVAGRQTCVLMPSVMAANGGSLLIERKETSRPPSYRVHWAGRRTDSGPGDCGVSAELTLPLAHLRTLANIAGGFGVDHRRGMF